MDPNFPSATPNVSSAGGIPAGRRRLLLVAAVALVAFLVYLRQRFDHLRILDQTIEHTEQIRRVMLPWYAPSNQPTQLAQMKDQARKLVAACG